MQKQPHRRRALTFVASAALLAFNGAVGANPTSRVERLDHMTSQVIIAPADKWSETLARTVTPSLGTGGSVIVSVPVQTIPMFGSYGAMSGGTARGAWAKVIIAPMWTEDARPIDAPASDSSCEYCLDGVASETAASFSTPATLEFGTGSRGLTAGPDASVWRTNRAGTIPASTSARENGPLTAADHGVLQRAPDQLASDARGTAFRFEANPRQDGGTDSLAGTVGYGSSSEADSSGERGSGGSNLVLDNGYQAGGDAEFGHAMDDPALVMAVSATQACCMGLNDDIATDFSDVSRWDATLVSESIVPVPEPGTLVLLGLGLVALGFTAQRKPH